MPDPVTTSWIELGLTEIAPPGGSVSDESRMRIGPDGAGRHLDGERSEAIHFQSYPTDDLVRAVNQIAGYLLYVTAKLSDLAPACVRCGKCQGGVDEPGHSVKQSVQPIGNEHGGFTGLG
jgi:hypothetical protein